MAKFHDEIEEKIEIELKNIEMMEYQNQQKLSLERSVGKNSSTSVDSQIDPERRKSLEVIMKNRKEA